MGLWVKRIDQLGFKKIGLEHQKVMEVGSCKQEEAVMVEAERGGFHRLEGSLSLAAEDDCLRKVTCHYHYGRLSWWWYTEECMWQYLCYCSSFSSEMREGE
ncbi:hypothetical protein PHAVU_009G082700 [Phaseolus vulgaris]|uniref:Uncharacterized protein n=1 Tax=Phaseolus vulgaris TaxID=3885 RepID=V7AU79_PHAVU|nr:hypothetical protein PHAVU_009G082700g [Phaseolus vulgaris]ESW08885.1 hypothetical protein PHAVU_009G082700g [Phaseolus vulgaris]